MTAVDKVKIVDYARNDPQISVLLQNAKRLQATALWGCYDSSEARIIDLLDFVIPTGDCKELGLQLIKGLDVNTEQGVWCWVSNVKQADVAAIDLSFLLEVNYQ